MKQVTPVDAELIRRLQKTSRYFLLHALEHALADERNETNAIQTLANIQAALELLTKLRIVRIAGWQGIAVAHQVGGRAAPVNKGRPVQVHRVLGESKEGFIQPVS